MTVMEMIRKLSQLDPNLQVTISDGYNGYYYEGDFDITVFEESAEKSVVDIGIGGYMVREDSDTGGD